MQLRSLGSSALNLRAHHLSIGVHAPFAPSALPRRSLASVARPGSPCGSLSVAVRFSFAKLSLPEVLRPSSGFIVHLPHVASHPQHACPASLVRPHCCRFRRVTWASDTSRVLSPSSRPCIDTCQACSIPAPLMGFCLQRSVHILSRTPLGSPCPAFPWPRRRPLGHVPFGSQVFRPLPRLFSFADGLPALASDRSIARLRLP